MTILLDLTNGSVRYNLQNVLRATATGQVIEYDQFNEKLRSGDGEPLQTLGVDDEFYVDTTNMVLYYKINGTWTSLGGGADLTISVDDDVTVTTETDNIDFTGSYWDVTANANTAEIEINEVVATDTDAGTAGVPGLISGDDKEKLDGIAPGAEVNVQSDWAETDTTADSYINSKPTITNYNLTAVSGSDRLFNPCLLYTSPSPRDRQKSRMPSSA